MLQKILLILSLLCASLALAGTSSLPEIKDLSKLKISRDESYRVDQHPHELLIAQHALIYGLGTFPSGTVSLVNGCKTIAQLTKAYRASEKAFAKEGITYVTIMWRILMQGELNAADSLYLFIAFSYHFDTLQGKILFMPTDNKDDQLQNIVITSYASTEESIPAKCIANLEHFINSRKGVTF